MSNFSLYHRQVGSTCRVHLLPLLSPPLLSPARARSSSPSLSPASSLLLSLLSLYSTAPSPQFHGRRRRWTADKERGGQGAPRELTSARSTANSDEADGGRWTAHGDKERGGRGRGGRRTAGRNFGSLPACFLLQRAPMKMAKENRSGGLSTGETPLVAGRGLTRD